MCKPTVSSESESNTEEDEINEECVIEEPASNQITPNFSQPSSSSEVTKTKTKSQKKISTFFDRITDTQTEEIDVALGKFVFSTNSSFRMVENQHFKDLVKLLRPSYRVPSRKKMASQILEKVH